MTTPSLRHRLAPITPDPPQTIAVPLASLQVTGPDAHRFLQGQLTNDLTRLDKTMPFLAAVCAPDGKLITIVSLQEMQNDTLRLITYREHLSQLRVRLTQFRIRIKADIAEEDLAWAATLSSEETPLWPLDTTLTTLGPDDDTGALAHFSDLRLSRLAIHLPTDAPEELLVASVPGLVTSAVSFTKGCYVGQELVARTDARGAKPPVSLFVRRYMPSSLEAIAALPAPPLPLVDASGDHAGEIRALLLEDTTVVISGWVKRRFSQQSGLMIDARPSMAIPTALIT
ncbi:MAG: hypothetical protein ACP5HZ_05235 [Ferrimicrobium sp.]